MIHLWFKHRTYLGAKPMRVQLLKERPTTIIKSYDQVIPSLGDGAAE